MRDFLENKKVFSRRFFLKNRLFVFFSALLLLGRKRDAHGLVKTEGLYNFINSSRTHSPQFYSDLNRILKGAEPSIDENFYLEIPNLAENGSLVPFKIKLHQSLETIGVVKSFYLLSTLNPNAWIASFYFDTEICTAAVSGRMRLAKTQDVYALAQLNNGNFLISKQNVEVLIGGCGPE